MGMKSVQILSPCHLVFYPNLFILFCTCQKKRNSTWVNQNWQILFAKTMRLFGCSLQMCWVTMHYRTTWPQCNVQITSSLSWRDKINLKFSIAWKFFKGTRLQKGSNRQRKWKGRILTKNRTKMYYI